MISFKCPDCGELHEGSPSVAYRAPYYWSEEYREKDPEKSKLDSDVCIIEEQYFFIRCVMRIPIIGEEEPFLWGVWVSQSKDNYRHYVETFHASPERATFGYLSNRLGGYEDTLGLKTMAHWQSNGQRPWIELEPSDHALYQDWSQGISWDRAGALAFPHDHRGNA